MSLLSAKVSVSDESDFHYVINITVTKSGCHYFVQDCRNSPIIMANTLPNNQSRLNHLHEIAKALQSDIHVYLIGNEL